MFIQFAADAEMDRALKPFPQQCITESHMDTETTAIPPPVRRRPWGSRRRTRSTGSLPFFWHQKMSDDSSSSVGGDWGPHPNADKGLSSIHQSDSENEVPWPDLL